MGSVWGSAITSVSAGLQAIVGNKAYQNAWDIQKKGGQDAAKTREDQYAKTQGFLDPYNQAGQGALGKLGSYLGTDGKPYDPNAFQMDPGYLFRLKEGQGALERSASARGTTLSGRQRNALTAYGQGMASQEFQNSYNRLMGMASMGLNAAGQQAGYSNQFGHDQAGGQLDLANAEAANIMSKYQNWQNLDSQAAGAWSGYFGSQDKNNASSKGTAGSYGSSLSQNNANGYYSGQQPGGYNFANGYNSNGAYGGNYGGANNGTGFGGSTGSSGSGSGMGNYSGSWQSWTGK